MARPRRRGNSEGSVYRVPGRKHPWAASITVGWTIEGKPIRRARYASSEREAKMLLSELRTARDSARPLPDDRMTVGKWLVTWLASPAVTKLRPNTITAYHYSVRLMLPELGSVPIRKLRAPLIEDALARINVTGVRSVLSTALKDAMRAGHVETNQASLARSPKGRSKGLPAPDTATVRAVLRELQPHRLHALYVLLSTTALRIGEATGLRWEDIDDDGHRRDAGRHSRPADGSGDAGVAGRTEPAVLVERGRGGSAQDRRQDPPTLTVVYQVQRIDGELVHTDPKTDSAGRKAVIPPLLADALRAHKARQNAERLAAGSKWRTTDLVFTTTTGGAVSEQTAHWVLARACERAGVRHLSLHDFRRFTLTQVEERLGREAAQRMGGHTDPRTTERYISTTDRMLADAAAVMEEAVGG